MLEVAGDAVQRVLKPALELRLFSHVRGHQRLPHLQRPEVRPQPRRFSKPLLNSDDAGFSDADAVPACRDRAVRNESAGRVVPHVLGSLPQFCAHLPFRLPVGLVGGREKLCEPFDLDRPCHRYVVARVMLEPAAGTNVTLLVFASPTVPDSGW